jgi:ribosomal protein S18 acetylase RimI-like enzyme
VGKVKSDKFLDVIRKNITKLPPNIEYQIYDPVKNMTKDQIIEMRREILEILEKNPNNIITGTYTYGNLTYESRENNLVIRIEDRKNKLIINCNPEWKQILIFATQITEALKSSINTLLNGIPSFFIFTSGSGLIEFLNENIEFDQSLSNIVYELDANNLYTDDLKHEFEVEVYPVGTILDKEQNKLFYDMWGYNFKPNHELDRPHVLVTVNVNGHQLGVGGARANEVIDGLSVIGGVHTKKAYRRRGIGFLASYKMAMYLLNTGNRVFLETDVGNFPARKIYEKIGFKEVGVSKFYDSNTGVIPDIMGDRDY